MRTAFFNELIIQARTHPEIFLVVGDIGFSVIEPFVEEFPDRFLNAGVAEQNMTGMAAGLASEGYHVFTYSIANFPTLRCLEQIRNDVCYHHLPVTVVAVGSGMAYGNQGYSHHGLQDLGILRTLGELAIYSPADPGEARECLQSLVREPRPSYLRLGKAGEVDLHAIRGLERGPLALKKGTSACAIVSTGSIVKVALEAAALLRPTGLDCSVFSFPKLQPLTGDYVSILTGFPRIVVVEEHVAAGGLAGLLRDLLSDRCRIKTFAVPGGFSNQVGTQEYMRCQAGLTGGAVADGIVNWLAADK